MTIKDAIIDVITKLRTIPGLKVVRMFNDQFNRLQTGEENPIDFPSVFIEILSPAAYKEIGGGLSAGDLTWRIHIADQELDAGSGNMDQNLKVYDLRDKVHKALNLFRPSGSSHFQKSTETADYSHKGVYHYIIDYRSELIESSGAPTGFIIKQPPTDLTIDIIIVPGLGDFQIDYNNDFSLTSGSLDTLYNIHEPVIN